jgi:alcohol-forming fatty acyl-CoA reductase
MNKRKFEINSNPQEFHSIISSRSKALPVINCCLSNYRNATYNQIIDMGKALQDEIPLGQMLWVPGGSLTRCRYLNYIKVIFLQLLPAMLIDQLLKVTGTKPL